MYFSSPNIYPVPRSTYYWGMRRETSHPYNKTFRRLSISPKIKGNWVFIWCVEHVFVRKRTKYFKLTAFKLASPWIVVFLQYESLTASDLGSQNNAINKSCYVPRRACNISSVYRTRNYLVWYKTGTMYIHTNIIHTLVEVCSRNDRMSKLFITLLLILEVSGFSLSPEVGHTDSDSLGFPQILPLSISTKSQIIIHWCSFSTLLLTYLYLDVANERVVK